MPLPSDPLWQARWRPYHNYCGRLSLAWAFSYAIFIVCLVLSMAYGMKFGNTEMQSVCLAWAIALTQTYCILEPMQIALAAGAPCLFDESHACGRCCLRWRFVYNEIFTP